MDSTIWERALSAPAEAGQPFYVTGGTLPLSAASYVERAADAALRDALQRGQFCYVLNTRQMGKSSLMARTASLLRLSGAAVVVLDLTAIGQNLTAPQWYKGLLTAIGEQIDLEEEMSDYWHAHTDIGPMQRFLGALRGVALPAVPGNLVVFIDEIDAVRSLPFATDELFAGIRELFNRRTQDPQLRRLTFCLLGVATPADLIRDTRTTPFNIGTRIDLTDFTPTEAAPLAQGMVGSRAVLDRVLHWTAGHPYLTQRLCRTIADEPQDITTARQVDRLCGRLFLSPQVRDTEDNLLFVRERVLGTELDLASLLTLYAKVARGRPAVRDDPADPLVSALKLAGVVKADGPGRLHVRNRIYTHVFGRGWIAENMPGAEVRRQRRAFRRGALRVGIIAGVVLALVGTLAGIAVKEARTAQTEERIAQDQAAKFERLLYVSDMQNAQSAWDDGNLGRLRALLSQTKDNPERGFEWGYWNRLAHPAGEAVQVGSAPLVGCDATRDGSKLLTAGGDGMLRVWDARTLRPLYSVRYPGPAIAGTGFSRDGSRWTANDSAGGLAVYDTADGRRRFWIPADQPGVVNYTSSDLKFAVRHVHDAAATILSCDTGKTVCVMPHRSGATDNPHTAEDNAATAHDEVFWFDTHPFLAALYDMSTGRRICRLQLPPRLQSAMTIFGSFSNDDRTLVTLSWSTHDYDLWDAATGRLIRHLDTVASVHTSFWVTDPCAPLVLIRDNERLRAYSTKTGRPLLNCSYPETDDELSPSAFSPDGRFLSLVGSTGAIIMLDCKTGKNVENYLGHTAASVGTSFLPQGRRFISVAADGSLRRWDRGDTGQAHWHTVRFPPGVPHNSMLMLPDQSRIVLFQKKPIWRSLWSVAADRARHMRNLGVNHYLILSENHKDIVTYADYGGVYTEYDVHDGHVIGTWNVDKSHTDTMDVSPDGRYLATYSKSGMTSVSDMRGNARLWSVRGSNSDTSALKFSPSGRLVASGGVERIVDVWDARTGHKIASLSGSTGDIESVTILQGDRHLAAACSDQTMRGWDIASGRLLWTVQIPQVSSRSDVRQSPDGNRLLIASESGGIFLWDAGTGDLLLKIKTTRRTLDARFSSDGSTLEANNPSGDYIKYAADMRPRAEPPPSALNP